MIMWMMNSLALTSKVSAKFLLGNLLVRNGSIKQLFMHRTHESCYLTGCVFALLYWLSSSFCIFFKLQSDIAAEAVNYLRIVRLVYLLLF